MRENRTLTLHIGIPKTASTWLQESVFQRLPGVRAAVTPEDSVFRLPEDRLEGSRLFTNCLRRSAAVWDHYGDEIFSAVLGPRDDWLSGADDALFSDEGIGRAGSRPSLLQAHLSAIRNAASRWGFSRVQTLCVIRRQDHWLASHYAQISNRNPDASQAGFESSVDRTLDPRQGRYQFGMLLEYGALLECINAAMGAGNWLVLPYEQLVREPAEFHRRLLDFLGQELQPNMEWSGRSNVRSVGELEWRLRDCRRRRSPAIGRIFRPQSKSASHKVIRLTEPLSEAVLASYAKTNRHVSEVWNIDLDSYGYFVDGKSPQGQTTPAEPRLPA